MNLNGLYYSRHAVYFSRHQILHDSCFSEWHVARRRNCIINTHISSFPRQKSATTFQRCKLSTHKFYFYQETTGHFSLRISLIILLYYAPKSAKSWTILRTVMFYIKIKLFEPFCDLDIELCSFVRETVTFFLLLLYFFFSFWVRFLFRTWIRFFPRSFYCTRVTVVVGKCKLFGVVFGFL